MSESTNQTPSSFSVAQTYTEIFKTQVNPRNGLLSLAIAAPCLPGIHSMNVNLGVTYSQGTSKPLQKLFGLPPGWSFPLSYIWEESLVIHGAQSYILNFDFSSGLQYYYKKDLKLEACEPRGVLPYGTGQKYAYILKFLNGHNQYFDSAGKLICWDDKSGNYMLFQYDEKSADVTTSKLTNIIDTYGQNVQITHSFNAIQVRYPPSELGTIQFSYNLSGGNLGSYTDPNGDITDFTFGGGIIRNDLLSEVKYPNQSSTKFKYSTIRYLSCNEDEYQDVVSTVKHQYLNATRMTSYDYDPHKDGHNYLGYPQYTISGDPNTDALFESNDNQYMYRTCINDGKTATLHEYNHLHLLLQSTTLTADEKETIKESVYTYVGEGADHSFPAFGYLNPNYMSIAQTQTTFYNKKNQTRQEQISRTYTDNGRTQSIEEYEQLSGKLKRVRKGEFSYSGPYSLPTQVKVYDYKPNGVLSQEPDIIQVNNSLSPGGGKYIVLSTRGFVKNAVFQPELKTNLSYDSCGRLHTFSRTWIDASRPGVQDLHTTFDFTVDTSAHTLTQTTTNCNGNASTVVYDLCTGFQISRTNALGATTSYTYDGLGRYVSETDPMGSVTTWKYDTFNNKVTQSSPNGYVVYSEYNGFGQFIQRSDLLGDGGTERILQAHVYDTLGRLESQSELLGEGSKVCYTYNNRSQLSSETDADGNCTTYTYDSAVNSKTTSVNGILSKEIVYGTKKTGSSASSSRLQRRHKKRHQRRVLTTVKKFDMHQTENYRMTTRAWNGFQLGVKTSIGSNETPEQYSLTKTYNLLEHPTELTLNCGDFERTLNFVRDLHGKVLQETCTITDTQGSQTSSSSQRTYDGLGQFTLEKTAMEQVRSFTYDAAGNRNEVTQFDGTSIQTIYNANNQIFYYTYTEGDAHVQIQYGYDEVGHVVSIKRLVNGVEKDALNYTYTSDGHISSITYPDQKRMLWSYTKSTGLLDSFTDALGNVTNYSYDNYGRLSQVLRNDVSAYVNLTYISIDEDAANVGRVASLTFSNGIQIHCSYDGYGQPQKITASGCSGCNPITIEYTYNSVTSFVTQVRYRCSEGPQRLNCDIVFTYDGSGRLIQETSFDPSGYSLESKVYNYDASANVSTCTYTSSSGSTETKYTYDLDNQLTSIEAEKVQQLSYDPNNNLVQDEDGNIYQYNVLNQLIQFTPIQGESTTYTYYPNGLRATKQIGSGNVIQYYYNDSKHPDVINEVQGDAEASYLMFASNRFARLFKDSASSTLQSYLLDRESVFLTFGPSGSIQNQHIYSAYGVMRSQTDGRDIQDNPFGYRGEYRDPESGLVYLRARYYAPERMRFVSRDSFLMFNPYGYVDGNPVMHQDPSGHLSSGAIAGIVLGSVAAVALIAAGGYMLFGAEAIALEGGEIGADAEVAEGGAGVAEDEAGVGEGELDEGAGGGDEPAGGDEGPENVRGQYEYQSGRSEGVILNYENASSINRQNILDYAQDRGNPIFEINRRGDDRYGVRLVRGNVDNIRPLNENSLLEQKEGLNNRGYYRGPISIKPAR